MKNAEVLGEPAQLPPFQRAFARTIRAHQQRTELWRRRALALLVLSIWLAAALLFVLLLR